MLRSTSLVCCSVPQDTSLIHDGILTMCAIQSFSLLKRLVKHDTRAIRAHAEYLPANNCKSLITDGSGIAAPRPRG